MLEALLRQVRELAVELHPRRRRTLHVTLDSELDRGLGFDSLSRAELLLRLAHGAPLAALALAGSDRLVQRSGVLDGLLAVARGQRDPLAVADAWQSLEPTLVLDTLAGWVCDLLRLRADPQAAHLGLERHQLAVHARGPRRKKIPSGQGVAHAQAEQDEAPEEEDESRDREGRAGRQHDGGILPDGRYHGLP